MGVGPLLMHFADFKFQYLREVTCFGERNRLQIEKWNSNPLDLVERTIHDVVEETALRVPNEEAICSWDGNLTYQCLYEHATRVAEHLIALGVGAEVVVPLCFDKEKWNVVAMLGVMIAGGCCTCSYLGFREHCLSSNSYPA
jgi:non-ribosomal peptide synthetase component F